MLVNVTWPMAPSTTASVSLTAQGTEYGAMIVCFYFDPNAPPTNPPSGAGTTRKEVNLSNLPMGTAGAFDIDIGIGAAPPGTFLVIGVWPEMWGTKIITPQNQSFLHRIPKC